MTPDDLLALAAAGAVLDLDDGDVVIRTGETDHAVHVLMSGALAVRRGGIAVASLRGPGAIVGELGLLLGTPATADVVVDGGATVGRLDDARELFRDQPEFGRHLAILLAQRLQRATNFLGDLEQLYSDAEGALGLVPAVMTDLLGAQQAEDEV